MNNSAQEHQPQENDDFLPKGVGHWKMPDYDVYLLRSEEGPGSAIILCRPNWDYSKTREEIKKAKGMEAWNTPFKFTEREDQSFFYLENGQSVKGDGMRFVSVDRNHKDFLEETIRPLAEAGFIPQSAAEWYTKT